MKKLSIGFYILFIYTIGFSQGFITTTNNPRDERPMEVKEFDNFYLVSGSIKSGNYYKSYLLKYSKSGVLIKQVELDSLTINFTSFKKNTNEIILIQSKSSANSYGLLYSVIDTNLNLLNEKFYPFPNSLYISGLKARMMNDSSIIVAGYTNKLNAPVSSAPFYFKLNVSGDSINSVFLSNYGWSRGFDVLQIQNSYYLFNSYLCNTCSLGTIIKTNLSLEIKDTINIEDDLYDMFSPILINDTTIQIFTRKNNSTKLYLTRIDTFGNKIIQVGFGSEGGSYYPAMQNGMSNFINESYLLYTNKFSFNSPFFGNGNSSDLVLTKLNQNLDTLYSRFFSFDKYLNAWAIRATTDGGCIFVSSENDTINHNNNRDILIIKVDSNGFITWTQNIEPPKKELLVYPNPADKFINIVLNDNNTTNCNIDIYNNIGQFVMRFSIHSNETKIDIRGLIKGAYIMKITSSDGRTISKKFIKN